MSWKWDTYKLWQRTYIEHCSKIQNEFKIMCINWNTSYVVRRKKFRYIQYIIRFLSTHIPSSNITTPGICSSYILYLPCCLYMLLYILIQATSCSTQGGNNLLGTCFCTISVVLCSKWTKCLLDCRLNL